LHNQTRRVTYNTSSTFLRYKLPFGASHPGCVGGLRASDYLSAIQCPVPGVPRLCGGSSSIAQCLEWRRILGRRLVCSSWQVITALGRFDFTLCGSIVQRTRYIIAKGTMKYPDQKIKNKRNTGVVSSWGLQRSSSQLAILKRKIIKIEF